MNILITNSRLDTLGGAETFVRDLACGLEKLGHSVIAYCLVPADAELLEAHGMVATISSLDELPFRPDVIHAQHHMEAMSAVLGIPGVPAVYHCHGAVWRETPPRHPRIHRYLAMSRTLAERMMIEANIPPSDITVWLNTVDLTRFTTVRQPKARPEKALFYNKIHGPESRTVTAIAEAASRLGIGLDYIGKRFDRLIPNPEEVLPGYDIVFASGRSAIDALACGCAVIVMGRSSCGEMVTPENYERLRQANFSIAVNSPPPSAEKIETQMRRYTSEGSAHVTQRLRQDADASLSMERMAGIYADVIAKHKTTPEDLAEEMRANARYLRQIAPLVKTCDYVNRASMQTPPP